MTLKTIAALILAAGTASSHTAQSTYVLSSGPFGLPGNARSVDWQVVNNSPDSQIVSVTVYQLRGPTMNKTPVAPGRLTFVVHPQRSRHNANSVGTGRPFQVGGIYEVVVELNDKRVLPSVDVWSTTTAVIIPGTHLSPQDFSDISPGP